jgi:DNA polymerase V
MFCLCDGTSFYACSEQIFRPELRNKIVLVASNNDGVVVALSPTAKAAGFKKFTPLFEIQDEIKKHGATVLSSNYELYSAISDRFHSQLSELLSSGDRQYRYSIDESFLHFNTEQKDWFSFGRYIRRKLWTELRVPTGVGFGPTLTLAKAANHASKRLPGFRGVCHLDDNNRAEILGQMSATDVWGIGNRIGARLLLYGVRTALDLSRQDPAEMKRVFNINVANTIYELNGEPKLDFSDVRADKKQIFSTRTFGDRVTQIEELTSALVRHSCNVVKKARNQGSLIKQLLLFAHSRRAQAVSKSVVVTFASATNCYTAVAKEVCKRAAELHIFGVDYAKCGAGAILLVPAKFYQSDLFASPERPGVSAVIDSINQRFESGVKLAASMPVTGQSAMKRCMLTPSYLTCWRDLPIVHCF